MRAQVPYLAGLARRAAGPAPLQPPRLLFAGTAYPSAVDDSAGFPQESTSPREAAGRGFSPAPATSLAAEEPSASPPITPLPGGDTPAPGEYPADDAPAPIDPAIRAGSAGGPAAPVGTDRSGPTRVTPAPHAASAQVATAQVATATPATPTPAGLIARPAEPPAHAAGSLPQGSAAIAALWGAPVDLPHTAGRPPATREASTRPAAGPARPQAGPAALPGPGPVTAGPDQGEPGGTGSLGAPGGGNAVSGRGRSAAIRDLLPLPAQAPRSAELAGPAPGRSRPGQPGGPVPTRVSIGTIEVTVVPPARPAPSESRPPAQMPPSRPPSRRAAITGADRLRDGLRRWYGIAQG